MVFKIEVPYGWECSEIEIVVCDTTDQSQASGSNPARKEKNMNSHLVFFKSEPVFSVIVYREYFGRVRGN